MKFLILVAITVVGGIGSWLGALMDHGNYFGGWSILWGTVGSLVGVWVGYKFGKAIGID